MENIDNDSPRSNRNGGPDDNRGGGKARSNSRMTMLIVLAIVVALAFWLPSSLKKSTATKIPYHELVTAASEKRVLSVAINNDSGKITGKFNNGTKVVEFESAGPHPPTDDEIALFRDVAEFKNVTPGFADFFATWLLLPLMLIIFYVIFMRRSQGQMSGIMSIGRSRAKVFAADRPKTTFADVAGYTGVKREITEVVDFLKNPERFRAIGAKIPKGVLLVGPPGTGKTLIARAVAGEAGVPFLYITGSDFMEMFVGVGASRVRDLFQTARKQAPAIIFVDEIDSIGRKRGAGLGGGHDEREQTLNQMLAEMDGFEASEGIVMLAATNRPDILDPALLRPGRFDRQIVVPLPDLEERLPILKVHTRNKKIAADVNLSTVARGTPGMSGADLANLVNEAALHAVRHNETEVHMRDFEAARDRIFMGQRREATVLSDAEKKMTAFHEGGHAVLAYVLPKADPVHKVTILPTGMALGVTQQLPLEERHSYDGDFIRDRLAVLMGGRVAERLVFGNISTGGSNDLQVATEMARSMVREWGMSERIGPMAWGSQGQVFLGEDLMHSRDYSEDTARVVDEEVERILREEETRATEMLKKHRKGLDAVAAALLERETCDGDEVTKLIDDAYGSKVHPDGKRLPQFIARDEAKSAGTNGNGNGKAESEAHGDEPTDDQPVKLDDPS